MLFRSAESAKKADPTRRGRFNFGEKTVLALCDEATIVSTKGGVRFAADGRHVIRKCRTRGTLFTGRLRMTNDEMAACVALVQRLFVPSHVVTRFNGMALEERTPIAEFSAVLTTDIADADGNLVRRPRRTAVAIFEPRDAEPGMLYELGIPVVETGDTYHVDVRQKVPLNLNRDNVPPSFLRDVRTHVVNQMHDRLTAATANTPWVRNALADPKITADAVRSIVQCRFGDKTVAYDPSDIEANKRAVSNGYTVVTGSQMSKDEWSNVRRAGSLPAAGRVTPTPKPFTPGGKPLKVLERADWTAVESLFDAKVRRLARVLLGFEVELVLANDPGWRFNGAYGGRRLTLNRSSLPPGLPLTEAVVDLLLHEFGHEFCSDHLSSAYHEALTMLGARLAFAVARDPTLV